jgi:hypothetical protein
VAGTAIGGTTSVAMTGVTIARTAARAGLRPTRTVPAVVTATVRVEVVLLGVVTPGAGQLTTSALTAVGRDRRMTVLAARVGTASGAAAPAGARTDRVEPGGGMTGARSVVVASVAGGTTSEVAPPGVRHVMTAAIVRHVMTAVTVRHVMTAGRTGSRSSGCRSMRMSRVLNWTRTSGKS